MTNDFEKLVIVLHFLQIMQMNMIVLIKSHLIIKHIARLTKKYFDKNFFINFFFRNKLKIMIINYEKISKNFISIYYNNEQKKILKIKC